MTTTVHMVSHNELPALPDDPSRQFGGTSVPVNGIPRFEAVHKKRADGKYDIVEYVDIMIPGDPRSMPRHKVTDRLREKYRPWYEQWKRNQEMAPSGTPLEMWPVLTPAQVHELKYRNIMTVEQLAGLSDTLVQNIPMGMTMRSQAKTWLQEKESTDAIENRRRESDAMRDSMRMLEAQVSTLMQELEKERAAKAEQSADGSEDASDDPDLEAKRARMARAREARAAKLAADKAQES